MVYGMIQRHSAELEIDSAIGQGTTVRLIFHPRRLPSLPPTTRRGSPRSLAAAHTVGRRRSTAHQILRDTLQEDGHVITATSGGQAGIDALQPPRSARTL